NAHVKNPVRVAIGSTTAPSEHVDLHLYEVDQDRKLGLLNLMLKEQEGTFLVFTRTKHGADRLAKKLDRDGVQVACIHGGRTQSQRTRALSGFQRGQYRVLVATNVASRGIHVEGIAHVVNFDLPQAPEDFIHRVGRTGRAGQRGTATTFVARNERGDLRNIERALKTQLSRQALPTDLAADPVELPLERLSIAPPAAGKGMRSRFEHASRPVHNGHRPQSSVGAR